MERFVECLENGIEFLFHKQGKFLTRFKLIYKTNSAQMIKRSMKRSVYEKISTKSYTENSHRLAFVIHKPFTCESFIWKWKPPKKKNTNQSPVTITPWCRQTNSLFSTGIIQINDWMFQTSAICSNFIAKPFLNLNFRLSTWILTYLEHYHRIWLQNQQIHTKFWRLLKIELGKKILVWWENFWIHFGL